MWNRGREEQDGMRRVLSGPTLSEENILRRDNCSVFFFFKQKTAYEMLEEGQTPISARLAEALNVTPPAVTAALKRMTRDGHVRVEREGRIDLTRKGRQIAERLALRHQLAEMLLADVVGFPTTKAP